MTNPTCYRFLALGSECVLHLYSQDHVAAGAAEAEILRIEQRYSRYRTDSLLSQINRCASAGGTIEVDDETAALLDYAFACHRKSGGLFDITTGVLRKAWNFAADRLPLAAAIERCLPLVGLDKICWERPVLSFPTPGLELDFGGIGKEYAADQAAAVCAEAGVSAGLVDLGGDIRVIGPRPDGTPWAIRLRDPRAPGRSLGFFELAGGGIATSGDYERCVTIDGQRYGHILNPRTGWPVRGLASVSVVAESCLLAGSIATITLLKGATGAAWLAGMGVPHVLAEAGGRIGGSGFSPDESASAACASVAQPLWSSLSTNLVKL